MQDRGTISKGIKEIKQKYQVTQKELAEIAGVSESTISHWSKGKSDAGIKSTEQLKAISDHFGEPYSIFGRTPTEEEKKAEKAREIINLLLQDNSAFNSLLYGDNAEYSELMSTPRENTNATLLYLISTQPNLEKQIESLLDTGKVNAVIEVIRKVILFHKLASNLWEYLETANDSEAFQMGVRYFKGNPLVSFYKLAKEDSNDTQVYLSDLEQRLK